MADSLHFYSRYRKFSRYCVFCNSCCLLSHYTCLKPQEKESKKENVVVNGNIFFKKIFQLFLTGGANWTRRAHKHRRPVHFNWEFFLSTHQAWPAVHQALCSMVSSLQGESCIPHKLCSESLLNVPKYRTTIRCYKSHGQVWPFRVLYFCRVVKLH